MNIKHLIRLFSFFLILLSVFFAGCNSSPYHISSRSEGRYKVHIYAEVPATCKNSELKAWGKEIAQQEQGKDAEINFYIGDPGENVIASYETGKHDRLVSSIE